MKAPLSYVPVLPATAGVIAGILLHDAGCGVVCIAALTAVFIILYSRGLHYLSFYALFTALGIIIAVSHEPNSLPKGLFGREHRIYGYVKAVKETAKSTSYAISLDNIDGQSIRQIHCMATVLTPTADIPTGSYVKIKARLSPVEPRTDVPYETDYDQYLKDTGIQCKCIAEASALTLIKEPDKWHATVNKIRDSIFNGIVTSGIDGATAAFLVAVILGDRQFLLSDDFNIYRSVGVAHILALSGMHVGILAMLITAILIPLQGSITGHKIRYIICILLIWAYAVIVGFTPSIVRAAVMLTVFDLAWFIQRGYSPFNSLLLSVLIILCINPNWLYAPGLQLSVCAVAAILAFSLMTPKKLRRHRAVYIIYNTLCIPIAAMIGTGMVSAYYFGAFPTLFLCGNVITGLMLPWILSGGTVMMILNICGIRMGVLGLTVDWLYRHMHSAVSWLAGIDGAVVDGIFISGWTLLPYFATIILLVMSLRRLHNTRLWLYTLVCGQITIIAILLSPADIPAAELYMTRTSATRLVMCQQGQALLWTDYNDPHQETALCNAEYSRFLQSRHCGDTFEPIDRASAHSSIRLVNDRAIIMGDRLICMVYDDTVPVVSNADADYAIICRGYRGSAGSIVDATKADTLLLASNLHPRVRQRLIKECADSIPYINLREKPFNIKIYK